MDKALFDRILDKHGLADKLKKVMAGLHEK